MLKRTIIILSAVIIFFAAGAVGGFYWLFRLPMEHDTATFIVKRGQPLIYTSEQLSRAGVIKYPFLFSSYARFAGADRKIRSCEYEFADGMSMLDILKMMVDGKCKLYKITLIEGWTLAQMADYLGLQPFAGASFKDDFLRLTEDEGFVERLEIVSPSLEGYLFPETYFVQRPNSAREVVSLFYGEFNKVWDTGLARRAEELRMTKGEIVTLASIIEKEAGSQEEMPFVSSVFHNRLKKNMPLQADPTVIYAIKDFDGNIRKSDLSIRSPYNTYIHAGLPPGPICNPGLSALKAALWPAPTKYLYFVSRGDKTHEFNEDYEGHLRAVKRYQSGK